MPRAIYRYEVPVDDRWHELRLSGAVLHVACRRFDVVELWALHSGGPELRHRSDLDRLDPSDLDHF